MSVDLEGRLKCFTISDILQLLGFSQQTGTLTLNQGWNSRTICFERGRITYIAAATRLPTIGELLIRAGKLDGARLRSAMASPSYSEAGLSRVLLDWGWVTEQDLKRCHDQLLEETIYSLFLWRNCQFTFESGKLDKAGGLAIDVATERLIIDGTRRVDEWIAISPLVPSMRMTFARALDDLEALDGAAQLAQNQIARKKETCSEQDLHVLSLVDGRLDGIALAKACGLTVFETAKSLAHLSELGLARAIPPDKSKLIELFTFVVESIHLKLVMFGHARTALEFEEELNRFARENGLRVHMRGGKVVQWDSSTIIETTALIDLYKLFIAIEQNRFSKLLDPEMVHGLVEGLYLHVDPELKELLAMYEFYHIEGLLVLSSR